MRYIDKLSSGRRSQNILLPVGCPGQWSNAKYQFDQIDKVLAYVNKKFADQGRDVTLFYSTAGEYINSLK